MVKIIIIFLEPGLRELLTSRRQAAAHPSPSIQQTLWQSLTAWSGKPTSCSGLTVNTWRWRASRSLHQRVSTLDLLWLGGVEACWCLSVVSAKGAWQLHSWNPMMTIAPRSAAWWIALQQFAIRYPTTNHQFGYPLSQHSWLLMLVIRYHYQHQPSSVGDWPQYGTEQHRCHDQSLANHPNMSH